MAVFAHIFIGILAFIIRIMPGMLVSLLKMLGVGIVTFLGLDALTSQAYDFIQANYSGLPLHVIQLLDLGGLHSGILMITSTATAIATFKASHALNQRIALKRSRTLKA